ncbi:MAG: glycoside hydrolase family 3 C-terminal domain-containing protein, partial [Oscillospiraceae bacterium]|nr:glycoside hydrolase family 3 C-terminal domain-containing protein [Oscillospiraceae bacterium]
GESVVLIKNNGLLPLKKDAKVVFIGELAENPACQGGGSAHVNPRLITSALAGAADHCRVSYCRGYDLSGRDEADPALEAEAVAAAKTADVCVLFIGPPHHHEYEGFDRDDMRLPKAQNRLVEAVTSVNPNTVVVLQNGAPVEMPWIHKVGALIENYMGGQAGGGALADILFGALNPCGKLAETLPIKLSDTPPHPLHRGELDRTEYREGVFVGYRYYDVKEADVLFPFGHGLSYTDFEYSNLTLSAESIDDAETLTVTADVTNKGSMPGKETVQLYVGKKDKDDIIIRPEKELRGFEKIHLRPGETKTVSFSLGKPAFSYYNTQIHDRHVLSGIYNIMVGRSSRDLPLSAEVGVTSTVEIPMEVTINTPVRDILRVKGGEQFLRDLPDALPILRDKSEDPESPDYWWANALPEATLRTIKTTSAEETLRQFLTAL